MTTEMQISVVFVQHCSKPSGGMRIGNFLISQAAVKKSSTLRRWKVEDCVHRCLL